MDQPYSRRRLGLRCNHVRRAACCGLGRRDRGHADCVQLCRGPLSLWGLGGMVQPHFGVLGGGSPVSARLRIGAGSDVDACLDRDLRSGVRCLAACGKSPGAGAFEHQLASIAGGRRGAVQEQEVIDSLLRLGASTLAGAASREGRQYGERVQTKGQHYTQV